MPEGSLALVFIPLGFVELPHRRCYSVVLSGQLSALVITVLVVVVDELGRRVELTFV